MRRYIVERILPGIGNAGTKDLRQAVKRSAEALEKIGSSIQFIESYVIADRTFCLYFATDEEVLYRHSEMVGMPADNVYEVRRIIDPTTAGLAVRIRA